MNAEKDDQPTPDDHDCEQDGHKWQYVRTERIYGDSVSEYKCRKCGERKVE